MERSGSQKFLLVISIINIVFAAFGIIGGIMGVLGGALVGAADPSEVSSALSGTNMTQGQASGMVVAMFLVVLLASAVELVVGILGVRAANDNQKIMPVWVLALVQVILYAVGLIGSIVGGSFGTDGLSGVLSLLFGILLFWVANNIKKQAGR